MSLHYMQWDAVVHLIIRVVVGLFGLITLACGISWKLRGADPNTNEDSADGQGGGNDRLNIEDRPRPRKPTGGLGLKAPARRARTYNN